MQVGVLGPVVARREDQPIDLGAPKQRALLTALALQPGRPASWLQIQRDTHGF